MRLAGGAKFKDGQNIRMIEPGSGKCLALKSKQPISVGGDVLRQDFECYLAAQGCVIRQIHLTHSARADFRDDPVMRECCVDAQRFAHYLLLRCSRSNAPTRKGQMTDYFEE